MLELPQVHLLLIRLLQMLLKS